MNFDENDELCFDLLRTMKGHKFKDGGEIAGFTITFKDKKTGEVQVVEI